MCSVENLAFSLETILENPNSELFKAFSSYLQKSYCLENLEFWIATQEYKEYASDRMRCENLIQVYIQPNSPQEINIPCDIRRAILEFYDQGRFHPNIFHAAAESVLELMRVNSFVPWLLQTNYHPPMKNNGIKHSVSSTSLSDRWNFKLKQISRKSWSSLDDSRSVDRFTFYSTHSVYKSMLKKIKRSLPGKH